MVKFFERLFEKSARKRVNALIEKAKIKAEIKDPLSEYIIRFKTIQGESFVFKWQGQPLRYMHISQRPHSDTGIWFMDNGAYVTIPWHQIAISSFEEKIIIPGNE